MSSAALPPPSADELRELFHVILTTMDNQLRRDAETRVVRALSNPVAIASLVQILRAAPQQQGASSDSGSRHLAAILLRKKIFTLWRSLTLEQQSELKTILLELLGTEPHKMVRFAIAHLVSVLAKAEERRRGSSDEGGWPELRIAIANGVWSESVDVRELSMVLAYSIAEVVGENSAALVDGLGDAVLKGLQDPVVSVQLAALKAVTVILPFIYGDKQVKNLFLAKVVPWALETVSKFAARPLLAVGAAGFQQQQQHVSQQQLQEEQLCRQLLLRALDFVEQLVEDLHTKSHSAHLASIFHKMLHVFVDRSCNPRAREHASEILGLFVQSKTKFVVQATSGSSSFVEVLIDACWQVLAEDGSISIPSEERQHDDDDDDDDENEMDDDDIDMLTVRTASMFAGRLLNTCGCTLPRKLVAQLVMKKVVLVVENPRAPALERKAAVLAMACIVEGNPGLLRRKVTFVLTFVKRLLDDTMEPISREAGAFGLTYFCMHLQPEILTHHSDLLPMIWPLLEDPVDRVVARVAETLDGICEQLGDSLEPYIDQLLPRVRAAIPRAKSLSTKENLVGAMGSMAHTACPAFLPYAVECLNLLREPMEMTTPQSFHLRARATEAVGVIAVVMGRDAFRPYFSFFMSQVVQQLQAKKSELREHAFGYLSNMCELLKEEFLPYLEDSLQAALNALQTDTAHYENKHLLAKAASNIRLTDVDLDQQPDDGRGNNNNSDDDDDEDDDDRAEEIHSRVRTSDLEEKCSAVYAIGVFADNLRGLFTRERMASVLDALTEFLHHFHIGLRCNVLSTVTKLTIAMQGLQPVEKDTTSVETLEQPVRDAINELLFVCLVPTLNEESDKEVVAAACDALCELVNFFGKQTFEHEISAVIQSIELLLSQQAACQIGADEDDDDDDADDDEEHANGAADLGEDHDHVLMDAVCDTIDTLAIALGPSFAAYFGQLAVKLFAYLQPDRPAEDFTMATGVLANVLQALQHEAAPYFDSTYSAVLRILYETDESSAKANCCFTFRVLVETCPHRITAQILQEMLQALWAVVASKESEIPAAVDNAISATCSIVRCLSSAPPTAAASSLNGGGLRVPYESILPAVFANVPMKTDFEEHGNVVNTLTFVFLHLSPHLFYGQGADGTALFAAALDCCARLATSRNVKQELKQKLGQCLAAVAAGSVVGPAMPSQQEQVRVFQQAVAQLHQRHREALSQLVHSVASPMQ